MSAQLFSDFRKNLAVANSEAISRAYAEITKRLNKDFWDIDSETAHSLQVGSYGRQTAIRDVSDLDMVFELPNAVFERLKKVDGNGPSQLLQEIRASIKARYPNTEVSGDGQVVVVEFNKFVVEVLPGFLQEGGSYRYGDSNNGGSWDNYCDPRSEMAAINTVTARSNRNLKHVAKMLRAWKNKQGVPMSGMLIDTLTYKFFLDEKSYDSKSYASYPELLRDVFSFLANRPEQDYWLAPGSGSRVYTKGKFQRKAKKAAADAQEALDSETLKKKHKLWKNLFGRYFPVLQTTQAADSKASYGAVANKEEFVEDRWPLDIQFDIEIAYDVYLDSSKEASCRFMEHVFSWLKLGRKLHFYVVSCNVPEPFHLYWKVRNVGEYAERNHKIRGQILADDGHRQRTETTSFGGEHYVECFVVKNRVCVARDRIDVPIELG